MFLNLICIFYSLLFFSSLLMIFSNNPVYSVFSLISIFINSFIIFIFFSVDFIGIILLLVYVGAIAILFLFIIMMINIKKIENDNNTYVILIFILFLFFFVYIIYFFFNSFFFYFPKNLFFNLNNISFVDIYLINDEYNNVNIVKKIGFFLFTEYYLFLFFSGLLLFISLIGAIFLTNFKKGYSSKNQYNQLFRKNNLINCHIL